MLRQEKKHDLMFHRSPVARQRGPLQSVATLLSNEVAAGETRWEYQASDMDMCKQ